MTGRPPLEFTSEERKMVESLVGYGVPQSDIAALLRDGIDLKTLRKHFRYELNTGKAKANAKIAQSLFQQATNGNITALIFWAKTQMGWREINYVDVTSRDANELTDSELADIAQGSSTGTAEQADSSKVTH